MGCALTRLRSNSPAPKRAAGFNRRRRFCSSDPPRWRRAFRGPIVPRELALPRADIGSVDPRNDPILQLRQFLTHLGQQRPVLQADIGRRSARTPARLPGSESETDDRSRSPLQNAQLGGPVRQRQAQAGDVRVTAAQQRFDGGDLRAAPRHLTLEIRRRGCLLRRCRRRLRRAFVARLRKASDLVTHLLHAMHGLLCSDYHQSDRHRGHYDSWGWHRSSSF